MDAMMIVSAALLLGGLFLFSGLAAGVRIARLAITTLDRDETRKLRDRIAELECEMVGVKNDLGHEIATSRILKECFDAARSQLEAITGPQDAWMLDVRGDEPVPATVAQFRIAWLQERMRRLDVEHERDGLSGELAKLKSAHEKETKALSPDWDIHDGNPVVVESGHGGAGEGQGKL